MRHHFTKNSAISWKDLMRPGNSRSYFGVAPLPQFHAGKSAYDPRNAWWLAELSRLIYRQDPDESGENQKRCGPTRNDYLLPVGLREVRFIRTRHVQCTLVLSTASQPAPFAVLVFRGTVGSLEAWLPNFYSRPAPWAAPPHRGHVHRGFQLCFEEIWPLLEPALAVLKRPLFYTGHSLGGALAVLTAARKPPMAAYTFGAPRIGDRAFVDQLQDRAIYRVYTARDIVPTMPPAMGDVHFLPVGQPFRLTESSPGVASRPFLTRLFHKPSLVEAPPAFLGDHAPMTYTHQLAQWMTRPHRS
jgi:hypothetical protein